MDQKEHSTLANCSERSQGKEDTFVVLLSELRGKHLFLMSKKWENMPIISPRARWVSSRFFLHVLIAVFVCLKLQRVITLKCCFSFVQSTRLDHLHWNSTKLVTKYGNRFYSVLVQIL
jgi:hypothetical protein